jgi:hypothetical protein
MVVLRQSNVYTLSDIWYEFRSLSNFEKNLCGLSNFERNVYK